MRTVIIPFCVLVTYCVGLWFTFSLSPDENGVIMTIPVTIALMYVTSELDGW